MKTVLILGAGKIGSLIAVLLARTNDYQVYLADIEPDAPRLKEIAAQSEHITLSLLDARDPERISQFIKKNNIHIVVSSLPFFCNMAVAKIAKTCGIHYFDLTEDTQTAALVHELAKDSQQVFMPQCGLAPGFISIIANHLMQHFPQLDTVKMRVGALPLNISNALQYSLTWSTDGLINEYGNICHAIENGEVVDLLPLDDLEEIKIDGLTYEAFNTSGGIGSLVKTAAGKVKQLSYKTIRYPGHCSKMRFLMNDLKLNYDRDILKRILENSLPKTTQDVVLVYASVTGIRDNELCEENYVKKFYFNTINNLTWSAIQLTTASSLCAVLDIVMNQKTPFHGLVHQEQISFQALTQNRFGRYFA